MTPAPPPYAQTTECSTGEVAVKTARGEIDCQSLTNGITISFANQGSIKTNSAPGIALRGSGDIAIIGGKIETGGQGYSGIDIAGSFDDITITNIHSIETTGESASGILINRSGESNDDDEHTTLTVGSIKTEGQGAHGISYSGHANPRDTSPDAVITVHGRIETKGSGSYGIIVEAPDTEIDVTIARDGAVIVNSEHTYSETSHYALVLAGLDDPSTANKSAIINNHGLVSGSVYADGCARFNNHGVLEKAKSIELGTYGSDDCGTGNPPRLLNSGIVRVGGKDEIRTMAITGDFVQDANGVLQFDINWIDGESDTLEIDGRAEIEGRVEFTARTLPRFTRERYDAGTPYVVEGFLKAGELRIPNLDRLAADTILLDFGIRQTEREAEQVLDATLRLSGLEQLNRNERSVFWGLNEARNQDLSGADAVVTDVLLQTDLSTLRLDLDRAGNEIAANAMHASAVMATADPVDMARCQPSGEVGSTFRGCVFVTPILKDIEIGGTFEQRPWTLEQRGVGAGLALYPESVVDAYHLAVSYQEATIDMPQVARARGDATHITASAVGTIGPVGVQIGAQHGSTDYAAIREMPTASSTRTIEGTSRQESTGFRVGIAIPIDLPGMTVRPRAGLVRTRVRSKGYTEAGADDLALTVAPAKMTVSRVSAGSDFVFPSFTIGGFEAFTSLRVTMSHNRNGRAQVDASLSPGGTDFVAVTEYPKQEAGGRLGMTFAGREGQLTGHLGAGYSRIKGGGSARVLHLAAQYDF